MHTREVTTPEGVFLIHYNSDLSGNVVFHRSGCGIEDNEEISIPGEELAALVRDCGNNKRTPLEVLRERTEILDEALSSVRALSRDEGFDYNRGVQAALDLIEKLKAGDLDSRFIRSAGDHVVRLESVQVRELPPRYPGRTPEKLFVVGFFVVASSVRLLEGRSFSHVNIFSSEAGNAATCVFLEEALARRFQPSYEQADVLAEVSGDAQPLAGLEMTLETRASTSAQGLSFMHHVWRRAPGQGPL